MSTGGFLPFIDFSGGPFNLFGACVHVFFFFFTLCVCVCMCSCVAIISPSSQCTLTQDKPVVCHFPTPAGQVRRQPAEVPRKVIKEEGKLTEGKCSGTRQTPSVCWYIGLTFTARFHTPSHCCTLIMVPGLVSGCVSDSNTFRLCCRML